MKGQNPKGQPKRPARWRRHLVQAELELPAPSAAATHATALAVAAAPPALPWWQKPAVVAGLAGLCAVLVLLTVLALVSAHRDRALAATAAARLKTVTLRATTAEHALRVSPNPRSWSAEPDAVLDWPEPPVLLELYLPVAYSEYTQFAVIIDKVDQGRVFMVQRLTPDSNRELRLALNSSAFGPGEYRLRLQGYTWSGERVDAGWVRLLMRGRP